MPEGPEIRRAADRIERAVGAKIAEQVTFAFPHLKRFEGRLRGRLVEAVETRGKAILVHFEGSLSVYAHSQLYGRWYVTRRGKLPQTNRSLRFSIQSDEKSALLYSASEIDVLTPAEVDRHPFLSKLGPDVLSSGIDAADLFARLSEPRFARRALHALLLDQTFIAGLGNYLRSEVLFDASLHPSVRLGDLSDDDRRRLARSILRTTRQAYRTGGVTNSASRVKCLKAQGMPRSEYRHQVFTRGGRPCWSCGEAILRQDLGGRKIFHCPECQPLPR